MGASLLPNLILSIVITLASAFTILTVLMMMRGFILKGIKVASEMDAREALKKHFVSGELSETEYQQRQTKLA